MQEAIDQYIDGRYKRREIRWESVRTLREALNDMGRHVGFDRSIKSVTYDDLASWIASISPNIKTSTLHLRVSTSKVFFKTLTLEGTLIKDPSVRLKPPKKPRGVPRYLNSDQVTKAIELVEDERELAVIALMVHCGCRRGEVAGIEYADLDLNGRTLVIRKGKGGHQRIVSIGDEAFSMLSSYITVRGTGSGHLIQAYKRKYAWSHDGLTPPMIGVIAKRTLRRAEISACGHQFRHTFAKDMSDEGAPLEVIQVALGHLHITTTQIYTPLKDVTVVRKFAGKKHYWAENQLEKLAS